MGHSILDRNLWAGSSSSSGSSLFLYWAAEKSGKGKHWFYDCYYSDSHIGEEVEPPTLTRSRAFSLRSQPRYLIYYSIKGKQRVFFLFYDGYYDYDYCYYSMMGLGRVTIYGLGRTIVDPLLLGIRKWKKVPRRESPYIIQGKRPPLTIALMNSWISNDRAINSPVILWKGGPGPPRYIWVARGACLLSNPETGLLYESVSLRPWFRLLERKKGGLGMGYYKAPSTTDSN